MSYCSTWGEEGNAVLYGRAESAEAHAIVRYYSYMDIGLEFCNTCLAAHQSGLMTEAVFERHYRPLVRLFLTENYPFVQFASDGSYLSALVRAELVAATAELGWQWELQHLRLAPPPVGEASPGEAPHA